MQIGTVCFRSVWINSGKFGAGAHGKKNYKSPGCEISAGPD